MLLVQPLSNCPVDVGYSCDIRVTNSGEAPDYLYTTPGFRN